MQRVQDVRDYSEIRETLFRLMDDMRARTNLDVVDDARIVIKPNICTMKGPETGATVDPLVVRFLAEWFLENYKINIMVCKIFQGHSSDHFEVSCIAKLGIVVHTFAYLFQ